MTVFSDFSSIQLHYNFLNFLNKQCHSLCNSIVSDSISISYQLMHLKYSLSKKLLLSPESTFIISINHNEGDSLLNETDIYKLILEIYNISYPEYKIFDAWTYKKHDTQFLWFRDISLQYESSKITLSVSMDINLMFETLRKKHLITKMQKRCMFKLYNPTNGIMVKKAYNSFNTLIN